MNLANALSGISREAGVSLLGLLWYLGLYRVICNICEGVRSPPKKNVIVTNVKTMGFYASAGRADDHRY